MRGMKGFILLSAATLGIFLAISSIYAQQESAQAPAAEAVTEPEAQWLWGEVISVDANTRQIAVKYFDYETDAEKEMTISADDKTTYENVKSILEIKPLDTLSVDYTVGLDGKNIAKNISVEKAESNLGVTQEEAAEGKPEQPVSPAAE